MSKAKTTTARVMRHTRVRKKVRGSAARPRLAVFRSLNHIYAQLIDDDAGHTMVAASTLDADLKNKSQDKQKSSQAELVGELIGKKALDAGITEVVFDRGGYRYHGRVKNLAESARKTGLKF